MTDIVERLRRTVQILSDADSGENIEINYFDIAEAAAEIERLRAASEWRDISTAPRDGTPFLVCTGLWMTVCCWNKHRGDWSTNGPVYSPYGADERPTHWMPLPAPPQHNEVKK